MRRSAIIAAAAVLSAGIAVAAGLLTAAPASARGVAPASSPGPSPNFGCYYQNQNIGAGETVWLTDNDGATVGYASCSMNDVLDVYYWPA
jgi:hypothetical protein